MGMDEQQKGPKRASRSALAIARVLGGLSVTACEDSPQERCVKARLKVWDAHSEKTPWRISEATGQTRSDFEAKARGWCAQEAGSL
jgi:hypothetical protein